METLLRPVFIPQWIYFLTPLFSIASGIFLIFFGALQLSFGLKAAGLVAALYGMAMLWQRTVIQALRQQVQPPDNR